MINVYNIICDIIILIVDYFINVTYYMQLLHLPVIYDVRDSNYLMFSPKSKSYLKEC